MGVGSVEAKVVSRFGPWAAEHWKKLLKLLSPLLAPTIINLALPVLVGAPEALKGYSKVAPYALNLVAIAIIAVMVHRTPLVDQERYRTESERVIEFHLYWRWFWIVWFMTYAVLTVFSLPLFTVNGKSSMSLLERDPSLAPYVDALMNLFANVANLLLILCYLSLARFGSRYPSYLGIGIVFLVVVTLPELIWLFARQTVDARSPIAVVIPIIILAAYAAIGTVSLALLTGRVESRAISPPLWVILLLYLYAAIQMMYPVIRAISGLAANDPMMEATIEVIRQGFFFAALALKTLLFILLQWLLQSGVLLFYFHWLSEIGKSPDGVDDERTKFVKNLGRKSEPAAQT